MKHHLLVLCGFLAGLSVALIAGKATEARPAQQVVAMSTSNVVHVGKGKARAWQLVKGKEAYMGVLTLAPGASVPVHRDKTEEYLFVIEGSGTISIDDVPYKIAPNTAVYMPAGAKVQYKNGSAPLKVVQVFANPGPEGKYKKWTPGMGKAAPKPRPTGRN